jgi:hypothetical protein
MVTAGIAISTMKLLAAKLTGMKISLVLSFINGAAVTLGFTSLAHSSASHHVYELRLYQVTMAR